MSKWETKWQDIEASDEVQAIRKKIQNKKNMIWRGKLLGAYNHYISRKRKGDYTYMVDEWDDFEQMKIDYELNKYKGEIIMSESRVLVRLTKQFCNIEVERSGIHHDEYPDAKQWVFNEAVSLLKQIPDEGYDKKRKERTPSTYTKEVKPQQSYEPKPTPSYVTAQDITTKFLKGGQIAVAVKRINKGDITLAEVNSATSWQHANEIVFSKK